jgi:hypothetical protein
MRRLIAAFALLLFIVVLLVLGGDRGVEETTFPTTVPTSSTTTTVPASALDGIVLYIADDCVECPLVESRLRDLAGEVPVWIRPADETVSRVPTVVVQFGGEVSARWEGEVAVNSAEAIATFAGQRWPQRLAILTTGTTPTEDAVPCFRCPLVAVSAGEAWAGMTQPADSGPTLIGHLADGVWAFYRLGPLGDWRAKVLGIAVAPEGTVWAATNLGVFSFDGEEWTRRFDGPAGAVTVDEGGTVWIGGERAGDEESAPVWLARWGGESWERLDPSPSESPKLGSALPIAVLPDGEVGIKAIPSLRSLGAVDLLRYDGATMEEVGIGYPGPVSPYAIEAAPNGDLWVGGWLVVGISWPSGWMDYDYDPVVVARFDGEGWTFYDWPFPDSTGEDEPLLTDLAVAPDGVVWVAGPGGLRSFDETEWTTRIEGQPVWSVDVAADGTVWYADEEGLHTLSSPG